MLHIGVHKHGASGAQIDGVGGKQRLLGELGRRIAQGIGKILNERATAGGTGFVQEDGIHRVVSDFNALHILTTDVQNAVHLRVKEGGCLVMGNGFHLPLVQAEGGFEQTLAIARGAGAENLRLWWQFLSQLTNGLHSSPDGRALIATVEGPEQLPLLAHQGQLGGGGAGINTQITVSPIRFQGSRLHSGAAVAGLERLVFLLILEEGRQALQLKGHGNPLLQLGDQPVQRPFHSGLCLQSSTHGGKEVGVFRVHHVLRRETQRADKGPFQLREEVQRPAQKGHTASDGLATGQAGDGLVDHRLEDGGSQIRQCRAVVDEGLNVGLGKHTAPGGNGINLPIVCRLPIQARGVGLEQGSHLVNERTGAAGTDAVHPLLQATPEVDDLGVLSAQLNGHVGLGRNPLQTGSDSHHLLDKADAQSFAQVHGARACDPHPELAGSQLRAGLPEKLCQRLLGVGPVAAVLSKTNLSVCI